MGQAPRKPIGPDFSRDWVVGAEHIAQDGSDFWQKKREQMGWSRQEVEELTDGMVIVERQTMFEDRPYFPELDELEALAHIYATSPGALLDACFEERGMLLRGEEEADLPKGWVVRSSARPREIQKGWKVWYAKPRDRARWCLVERRVEQQNGLRVELTGYSLSVVLEAFRSYKVAIPPEAAR